jgi:hypothetical protein
MLSKLDCYLETMPKKEKLILILSIVLVFSYLAYLIGANQFSEINSNQQNLQNSKNILKLLEIKYNKQYNNDSNKSLIIMYDEPKIKLLDDYLSKIEDKFFFTKEIIDKKIVYNINSEYYNILLLLEFISKHSITIDKFSISPSKYLLNLTLEIDGNNKI